MRCNICLKLSFRIICTQCQSRFLQPNIYKRVLQNDFVVYSFYSYDEVSAFITTKYTLYGDKIFRILAKQSFAKFAKNFEYNTGVEVVAVDDHTLHQFSQTAILARALQSKILHYKPNRLRAKNHIKYAGKSLEFRQQSPRGFEYFGKSNTQVVLVDDVVTTGTTLLEAKKVLEYSGCEVLFALCLADAKNSF